MPMAIGRSNAVPSLRTSAGARFTVMRLGGTLNPGIDERRTDPLATLLDRARREPDDRPLRKPLRRVDLDDDVVRVDADESSRTNRSEHRES